MHPSFNLPSALPYFWELGFLNLPGSMSFCTDQWLLEARIAMEYLNTEAQLNDLS
jgi:hypothetical protein